MMESESGVKVTGARKLLVTSPNAGQDLKDKLACLLLAPRLPSPPSTVMPVFWQSDLSKLLVSKFEHPKEWKRPAKVCHEHRSSDLPLLRSIEDDLAGAHWVLRVLSNVLIVSRPVLVVAEPVRGILSEGLRLLRLPQDAGCGSEHSRASACRNADLPSRLPSPSAKSLLNHPRSRGLPAAGTT